MKAVIQRVSRAEVTVGDETVGRVGAGLLVLLGVHESDTEKQATLLAEKTAHLRIFCDAEDKMNLSVQDIGGDILVVSNFTLCADTKKGNRPSFIHAMEPVKADELYRFYCEELLRLGICRVEKGRFRAEMNVSLVNDGPITVVLDTDTWCRHE